MNISITSITLTNFKCFKGENTFTIDAPVVTIRGRNGAGKTTIADAILFCLFGKNTDGQSDLEIFKTRQDGIVIPKIDHAVEITLSLSEATPRSGEAHTCAPTAKTVTLRRSIKEQWVKKRCFTESVFKSNTVEYFVNGESYTKADYEKYISNIVDERIFRAITNPSYFPSLKWQDQRAFLTAMAGEGGKPDDNHGFADLAKLLEENNEDIIAYLKHLKYQIKQVKDKLDKIPVRLEEQNKALPQRLDWDAIQSECNEVSLRCKDIEQKMTAVRQGSGSDIKRAELRKNIEKLRKKMYDIEDKAREDIRKQTADHNHAISELSIKFNQELNNQRQMEMTIDADKRMIERCKETIADCDNTRQKLLALWPRRTFVFDETMTICPTCGQQLPFDQIEERREKARQAFNTELEAERKAINEKGRKNNDTKTKAQKEQKDCEEKLKADEAELADIKERINTVFSEEAEEEKKPLPALDDFLPANEEYQAALREKACLESELEAVTDSGDNSEQLASLRQQQAECSEIISRCQQQLATRPLYDRITSLIGGINEEQKKLITQLSELEKSEDVARQYQSRQNKLLEEQINKHFRIVQWRLFRTVNNGGDSFDEPYCEAYVNGIPYHAGLNQAMRLNAGIDICETLGSSYGIFAPIVIDNAESNLDILQTTGQQIRLQVFDSELSLV